MTTVSRRDFGKFIGGAGAVAAAGLPTFAIAQAVPKVVVIGGGAGGATAAHYPQEGRRCCRRRHVD